MIFRLYRISEPDWDQYYGFVVRAENELLARELVASKIFNSPYEAPERAIFLDSKLSVCDPVLDIEDPKIILSSFKAG